MSGPWAPVYTGMAGGTVCAPSNHSLGWNLMPHSLRPGACSSCAALRGSDCRPADRPWISENAEVRTIFVTGFPVDMRERELANLLRFLPGFETCQINFQAGGSPLGFGLFSSGSAAKAAVRALNDVHFDVGHTLRAQMARSNMSMDGFPTKHMTSGPVVSTPKDYPPCNTLYIGNLGESTLESELFEVFGHLPGFQRLRLLHSMRTVSAFIVFESTPSAAAARDLTSGLALLSSDRGALRVQFSRNPSSPKRSAASANLSQEGSPVRPRLSGDDTSASS